MLLTLDSTHTHATHVGLPIGATPAQPEAGGVLLIDNDPKTLADLRKQIERVVDPSSLCVAEGAEEALHTLTQRAVDLIVTSLEIPDVDCLELLRQLREQQFSGRSVVISDHLTNPLERELRDLGAVDCLPKPIDIERLLGLCQCSMGAGDCEFRQFSPVGIAQLLEIASKSCLLRAQNGDQRGDLVFSQGRLVDASTAHTSGESAALEILAWESADMHVYVLPPREPVSISRSLQTLILEAARLFDEERRSGHERGDGGPFAANCGFGDPTPGLDAWHDEESSALVAPPQALDLPDIPSAALDRAFEELSDLGGTCRIGLVDLEQSVPIRNICVGSSQSKDEIDQECKSLLEGFAAECHVEDVLMTLRHHYHLMRPLRACRRLLLHVVLDRSESNLALARLRLARAESLLHAA